MSVFAYYGYVSRLGTAGGVRALRQAMVPVEADDPASLVSAQAAYWRETLAGLPDEQDTLFIVVNGACKENDFAIIAQETGTELTVLEDRALLAIQGPEAAAVVQAGFVPPDGQGLNDLLQKQCQCLGECKSECEGECETKSVGKSKGKGGKNWGLGASGNESATTCDSSKGREQSPPQPSSLRIFNRCGLGVALTAKCSRKPSHQAKAALRRRAPSSESRARCPHRPRRRQSIASSALQKSPTSRNARDAVARPVRRG